MDHIKYGPSKGFKPFWAQEDFNKELDKDGDWNWGELPEEGKAETSGLKFDKDLIIAGVLSDFSLALMAVSEVATFGAKKYKRSSWQLVKDAILRYTDAKWRHLLKQGYELRDEESGLLHEAHEAWNTLAVLELKLRDSRDTKRGFKV